MKLFITKIITKVNKAIMLERENKDKLSINII